MALGSKVIYFIRPDIVDNILSASASGENAVISFDKDFRKLNGNVGFL